MKTILIYFAVWIFIMPSIFSQGDRLEIVVQGKIQDKKSQKPIFHATVILFEKTDENAENKWDNWREVKQQQVDSTGVFSFDLEEDKEYKIIGGQDYYDASMSLFTTKDLPKTDSSDLPILHIFERNLSLLKSSPCIATPINLKDYEVLFPYQSYFLTTENRAKIAKMTLLLKMHPNIAITVEGHADTTEWGEYTDSLSDMRAKAVIKYMYDQKVPLYQLNWEKYGDTKLDYDLAQKHLNQRVEFRIISVDAKKE